jgi:patatin-like phospholipase/acyl hydrolase
VCRATAAAPTYFPPAYVTSVDGKINGTLIDGGAIQNNPVSIPVSVA